MPKNDLSIVIVNYNTSNLTNACIESLFKFTKNIKFEVIVVDNGSSEKLKLKNQNIKLIESKKNLGFTGGNNLGMKIAKGRYTLLLNSDTVIHDNVLGEMVNWMNKNPQVGISTCSLKNTDGSLQPTGGFFPTLPKTFAWMFFIDDLLPFVKSFHPQASFYTQKRELDWVTGAFLLVRTDLSKKVGLLDEDYFMYTEDTDFCYTIKKLGYKVMYLPEYSITHYGGASSIKEFPLLSEYKGIKIFYKKYFSQWQYSVLRIFLKCGALLRMIVFPSKAKIYAKAFTAA